VTLRPPIHLQQYRGHVLTVPPATEPVSLSEVKAQLVIDGTADDALLTGFIAEARQEIEDVTGLALITQTWRLSLDHWPHGQGDWWDGVRQGAIADIYANGAPAWVQMPRYPLASIVSVTAFDEAGNGTVITVPDVFDVDTYQQPGRMALKRGQTWPIALRTINAIQIDYTAGYGNAAAVPGPIKRAIRNMVAHMYSHRGDGCDAGDAYFESGAANIVGRYRVVKI
jgi:hypothetical protein